MTVISSNLSIPLSVPAWKRVFTHKLAQGEAVIQNPNGTPRVYSWIRDMKTGDLYWDEDLFTVAFKCGLIFFATPLYMVATMAWSFGACLNHLIHCEFNETIKKIKKVVTSPFYALRMELGALYGIVRPYEGRKIIARAEKAWHEGISYKEDFRGQPTQCGSSTPITKNCCWNELRLFSHSKVCYLAWCFQVRHNMNSEHDIRQISDQSPSCFYPETQS